MKEPDFDVKMLSKNGIDVPQFSGKEHFMLGMSMTCTEIG